MCRSIFARWLLSFSYNGPSFSLLSCSTNFHNFSQRSDCCVQKFMDCAISPPSCNRGDLAFSFDVSTHYLGQYNSGFSPVSRRRHYKTLIEPKHGIIKAVGLRFKDATLESDPKLFSVTATRISNETCWSNTLFFFEILKGYTKSPDQSFLPKVTPSELVSAHSKIQSKRKLAKILEWNVFREPVLSPGDLVQAYVWSDDNKRGKWLSPRTVLNLDSVTGVVTVPSSSGPPMHVALEDIRAAVWKDVFAIHVVESNDQLDGILDSLIDFTHPFSDILVENQEVLTHQKHFDNDGEPIAFAAGPKLVSIATRANSTPVLPSVGSLIEVFWPGKVQAYSGFVAEITDDRAYKINYDDERQKFNF